MNQTRDQKTVETFRQKKREILFDYLDVNRDGILDFEEIMFYPNKLTKSGKKEIGERLESLYSEAWRRQCDAINLPGDNSCLTKDQWLNGMSVLEKTDWFKETFIPEIGRMYFDRIDTDQDQTISLKEWRVYNNDRGFTDDSVIESSFKRLDTDGDGRISRDEMGHAIFQFSLGDDPSEDYSFLYAVK